MSNSPNQATPHDPERQMAHDFQQTDQDYLHLKAAGLNEAAATLPRGEERDGMLQKARRMKAASDVIDGWLTSPALRVPR